MKHTLLICILLISSGISREYDIDIIVERDNLFYLKFSDEIVSGKVYQMFSGNKVILGEVVDGKKDGKWTEWYESGQLRFAETYKDGELDGKSTYWHENGQKRYEATYKDGKIDGLWTLWYENGQKWVEIAYKNGRKDGLHTGWHENGQKRSETTFKDGELISGKCWDEDGNEIDCSEL